MTDTAPLASTESLLHPRQVAELREEKEGLQKMLEAPPHIRNQLEDGGKNVFMRLRDIDRVLTQAPEPIPAERIDEAVRLEGELREKWLNGMPTQAEMRRNPSGAVDKHMAWDKRVKQDVLRWKHLRRRLHASGISQHRLQEEQDISNVEIYRPVGGSNELNMHNEQIQGADTYLPPPGAAPTVVMTEEDLSNLRQVDPELADMVALLPNDARARVRELVRGLAETGGLGLSSAEEPALPPETKKPAVKKTKGPAMAELQRRCKELGLNGFGKNKADLMAMIAEAERKG